MEKDTGNSIIFYLEYITLIAIPLLKATWCSEESEKKMRKDDHIRTVAHIQIT